MPPPPDPAPPLAILEAEITALSSCLQVSIVFFQYVPAHSTFCAYTQAAVVKTGQIYGFYKDVKRL